MAVLNTNNRIVKKNKAGTVAPLIKNISVNVNLSVSAKKGGWGGGGGQVKYIFTHYNRHRLKHARKRTHPHLKITNTCVAA